nr:MAG TPA: hypothetical protein [Caudoviricetes sp.]
MLPCIKSKEVCSNTNKKCKECVFDECKEVINMNEEIQKYEDRENMRKLKKELPEQCKNCSFLDIINSREGKVYCPYMIKERCMIFDK